jgi:hypothetical protein
MSIYKYISRVFKLCGIIYTHTTKILFIYDLTNYCIHCCDYSGFTSLSKRLAFKKISERDCLAKLRWAERLNNLAGIALVLRCWDLYCIFI